MRDAPDPTPAAAARAKTPRAVIARRPGIGGLHLVSDRKLTGGALLPRIEAALDGGVTTVHLREKDLDARALQALVRGTRLLCARAGAVLLVNDRIDVALADATDGVHLPSTSFRIAEARALLGPNAIIGVSTHSPREVEVAARAGADYVYFGPVFATPSKAAYGPAQGVARLREAVAAADIAVIAIGGVTPERVAELRAAGAAGVAAIAALVGSADPASSARALRW